MKRALFLLAAVCAAQDFTQRGFLETSGMFYPQAAANDGAHAVGGALLRYEAFYKISPALQLSGGIDARLDTHREVERRLHLSWLDRETRRPALTMRRLSATYTRGRLAVEAGKQFIRWGKADILTPTDRFAPRDFLNVVDNDVLGVAAARLTYGSQSDTVDAIWQPLFTPSRIPLLSQRWAIVAPGSTVRELPARYPGGSQAGIRWSHIGGVAEYSVSFFDGFQYLPLFDTAIEPDSFRVDLRRFYPRIRMYGADAAAPLKLVTLKTEAAYFTSSNPQADEYVLYVIQLERQAGEWVFVGGYAGEAVTRRRSTFDFAPDRGLARAFLARAGYTIDTNRGVAFETAVRQNGHGAWAKLEYSQAFGQHWRATAAFTLIRGREDDFLGQYRRNSHARLALRYSF